MAGNCSFDGRRGRIESRPVRPISAKTTIDAPRERVFDLLADLAIRPAFTDHFQTEFRLGRVEAVGPGAAARFQLDDSGRWLDTVIEEAERPHLVREHGHGGRSNLVPAFTVWELVEGASREGSEVTVTFWTEPARLPDRIAEKLRRKRPSRRDFKRALERLRAIAEAGERPVAVGVAGGDRVPAFNPQS